MLKEIRSYRDYFLKVNSGESDINHIWPYYVAQAMGLVCVWLDTDAFAKASSAKKLLNYFCILFMFLLWLVVLIRLCYDYNALPLARVTENFGISMAGVVTFISFVRFAQSRDLMTEIIRQVDQKFLAVPKDSPRFKEWWKETRNIYIIEAYIVLFGMLPGSIIAIQQTAFALMITGRLYYDTAIPLSVESYSCGWWLQLLYQTANPIYSGICYSLKEFLTLDLFYHMSRLYKLQADAIMELCADQIFDPQVEYQKLQKVIREVTDLDEYDVAQEKVATRESIIDFSIDVRRITKKLNHFMFPYLTASGGIAYAILATTGIGIIIESKEQGWLMSSLKSFGLPAYVFLILATLAAVAEMLSDGVDQVDDALYNCNWTAAPYKIRRLILIYKIRFCKPTNMHCLPFFIINWELVAEILKKSYCFLTILADFLL